MPFWGNNLFFFPPGTKFKWKCQDSLQWQKFDSQTGSVNSCVNGAHAEPPDWFTRSSLGLLMQTPLRSQKRQSFPTLWLTQWVQVPTATTVDTVQQVCNTDTLKLADWRLFESKRQNENLVTWGGVRQSARVESAWAWRSVENENSLLRRRTCVFAGKPASS